jgi:dTDP-4-dehydrorhamnose reductase
MNNLQKRSFLHPSMARGMRTSFQHETRTMILLLGASGYFGRAFAGELRRRGCSFIPLSRRAFDYTRFDFLFDYIRTTRPVFVINAAGYNGCFSAPDDIDREQAMAANALLPQMIARVCLMTRTPWAHVSSGSIYSGVKVLENNRWRVERDSAKPGLSELQAANPKHFTGFNELDEPNFSFRYPPCDFCNGAKALAEEAIREIGESYIWRLREPFNERNEPCNLLARLPSSGLRGLNSLSHLEDCVRACLDLWEYRASFGIYNVVNPGAIDVGNLARRVDRAKRTHGLNWNDRGQVARSSGQSASSNCVLDSSKLLKAGVKLRSLEDALGDSLDRLASSARGARIVERVLSASGAPA